MYFIRHFWCSIIEHMRINKLVAQRTGLSRRAADVLISNGQVIVNGQLATNGTDVTETDDISINNTVMPKKPETIAIMFNKPPDCICSRDGQGAKTIYDYLPAKYHNLKSVGRLDKNSTGLLLLTNDGQLNQSLSHPKYEKPKIYQVLLDKPLTDVDRQNLEHGVKLKDGISQFRLEPLRPDGKAWSVTIYQGRNRQIRRTFKKLSYIVLKLHRTQFGPYSLGTLPVGEILVIS